MKKLISTLAVCVLLAGCGNKDFTTGTFTAYQNMTAQQIYSKARSDMSRHKYTAAAKDYQALDAIYPFGPYAQRGQMQIITAYEKSGDATSAQIAADRYIRLYPRAANVDYAYYTKGRLAMSPQGSWMQKRFGEDLAQHDSTTLHQSYVDFKILSERFPHSRYRKDALLRMAFIRNTLAKHEVEVGQFYFKRKAYVAAANRATTVIEKFEGSPQVIPALKLAIASYQKLNLPQQVDRYSQLLKQTQ